MASIEDREAAQRGNVAVLLRLIDNSDVSSVGDDHWVVYDDVRPEGWRVTDHVERLIDRGLARAKGYYDVHLTVAGLERLTELNDRIQGALP